VETILISQSNEKEADDTTILTHSRRRRALEPRTAIAPRKIDNSVGADVGGMAYVTVVVPYLAWLPPLREVKTDALESKAETELPGASPFG